MPTCLLLSWCLSCPFSPSLSVSSLLPSLAIIESIMKKMTGVGGGGGGGGGREGGITTRQNIRRAAIILVVPGKHIEVGNNCSFHLQVFIIAT